MPTDSLGIWIANSDSILKFANVSSLKTPEKKSEWFAFEVKEYKENKSENTDSLAPDTLENQN